MQRPVVCLIVLQIYCDLYFVCHLSDEKNCGNVNSNQLRQMTGYANGGPNSVVSDGHQSVQQAPVPPQHSSHSVNGAINPYSKIDNNYRWTTS